MWHKRHDGNVRGADCVADASARPKSYFMIRCASLMVAGALFAFYARGGAPPLPPAAAPVAPSACMAISSAAPDTGRMREYIDVAGRAANSYNYDEAEKYYRRAIQEEPKGVVARRRLAEMYAKIGKQKLAQSMYAEIDSITLGEIEVAAKKAKMEKRGRDSPPAMLLPENSAAAYEQLLTYKNQADEAERAGNFNAAVEARRKAVDRALYVSERPAAAAAANFALAQTLCEVEGYSEALLYFGNAMEIDTTLKERCHKERGDAFLKMGRIKDATREYEAVITLKIPIFNKARLEKNKELQRMVKHDAALLCNKIGIAYINAGKYKKAIGAFTRSLNFEENPVAYLNRGNARLKAGEAYLVSQDYMECEKMLRKALDESEPEQRDLLLRSLSIFYNSRGYMKCRQYATDKSAQEDFDLAISIDSAYALAFHNRGLLSLGSGKYAEAAKDLKSALCKCERALLEFSDSAGEAREHRLLSPEERRELARQRSYFLGQKAATCEKLAEACRITAPAKADGYRREAIESKRRAKEELKLKID